MEEQKVEEAEKLRTPTCLPASIRIDLTTRSGNTTRPKQTGDRILPKHTFWNVSDSVAKLVFQELGSDPKLLHIELIFSTCDGEHVVCMQNGQFVRASISMKK